MNFITLDNIRGLPNEDSIFYLFNQEDEIVKESKANKKLLDNEINSCRFAPPKERLDVIKAKNQLTHINDTIEDLQGHKYHQKMKCKYYDEMLGRTIGRAKFGIILKDAIDTLYYNCARCLRDRSKDDTEYNDKCKGCNYLICDRCMDRVISKDYGYCWFCQYEFIQGIKEKPKVMRVKGKGKK